jgi:hypothetical protein
MNFLLYYLAGERLDRWDPNVFLAALTTGIVALVVVSLLTPPEPAARMESFFTRLTTSSDEPETAGRPLLLVSILNPVRAAAGRGWRAFREEPRRARPRLRPGRGAGGGYCFAAGDVKDCHVIDCEKV